MAKALEKEGLGIFSKIGLLFIKDYRYSCHYNNILENYNQARSDNKAVPQVIFNIKFVNILFLFVKTMV